MIRHTKKRRTNSVPAFGAANPYDDPSAQTDVPSALASSTRSLPITSVPSLVTLCNHVFVAHFKDLRNDEHLWNGSIKEQLVGLPDYLIPRIFAMLRSSIPTFLTHEIITTVRLQSITQEMKSLKTMIP
jgi:hypothetical protein